MKPRRHETRPDGYNASEHDERPVRLWSVNLNANLMRAKVVR